MRHSRLRATCSLVLALLGLDFSAAAKAEEQGQASRAPRQPCRGPTAGSAVGDRRSLAVFAEPSCSCCTAAGCAGTRAARTAVRTAQRCSLGCGDGWRERPRRRSCRSRTRDCCARRWAMTSMAGRSPKSMDARWCWHPRTAASPPTGSSTMSAGGRCDGGAARTGRRIRTIESSGRRPESEIRYKGIDFWTQSGCRLNRRSDSQRMSECLVGHAERTAPSRTNIVTCDKCV